MNLDLLRDDSVCIYLRGIRIFPCNSELCYYSSDRISMLSTSHSYIFSLFNGNALRLMPLCSLLRYIIVRNTIHLDLVNGTHAVMGPRWLPYLTLIPHLLFCCLRSRERRFWWTTDIADSLVMFTVWGKVVSKSKAWHNFKVIHCHNQQVNQ